MQINAQQCVVSYCWYSVDYVVLVRHGCIVFPNDKPCYETYGGPWPSSELETQAVTSFILERKESLAGYINVHNYGQMILTRWAYTEDLYLPEHNETVRHSVGSRS